MTTPFQKTHILNIVQQLYTKSAKPLDLLLNHYFRGNKSIGSKDRKIISESIYGMVRWKGLLDAKLKEPDWHQRLTLWTEVGFDKLRKDASLEEHDKVSFPKPLFDHLVKVLGQEKAIEFCLTTNQQGPITVRVNTLKTTRESLFHGWRERYDVSLCKHSPTGIIFHTKINFSTLSEYKKGLFDVQDEASQMVAQLVTATPGDEVLDYCAGAGGKALAIAPILQKKGQIYLYDVRPEPLAAAKLRLKRAGVQNAQIVPSPKDLQRLKKRMHWIIADVPCSGSGTWRRNPDQKWKFSFDTLKTIVETQRAIVGEALRYLRPQGFLLYSTCSVFPEENEEQLAFFADTYNLSVVQPPLTTFPSPGAMDGFFGAVLTRK